MPDSCLGASHVISPICQPRSAITHLLLCSLLHLLYSCMSCLDGGIYIDLRCQLLVLHGPRSRSIVELITVPHRRVHIHEFDGMLYITF